MIKKEREKNRKLLTYEAFLRRLPENYPQRELIEKDYMKYLIGYKGEVATDFYLSELPDEYHIYNNLRIFEGNSYFQVDTLLLSPSFLVILEIKNYAGVLYFDDQYKQLIRTLEGKEEVFEYPILQVDRQRSKLKRWLTKNNFTNIPVENLVVISHPNGIIKTSTYLKEVIRSGSILGKVESFSSKFKQSIFSEKDLKKLHKLLLKEHTDEKIDMFTKYNIDQSIIKLGPCCPICFTLKVEKVKKGWVCINNCHFTLEELLKFSLLDYSLLFSPTITNSQFREFFFISSRYTAIDMIKMLGLKFTGAQKNRTYHIPY
ncbi:nuclease-related domain-containing protein [Sutcliffiella cohnii]